MQWWVAPYFQFKDWTQWFTLPLLGMNVLTAGARCKEVWITMHQVAHLLRYVQTVFPWLLIVQSDHQFTSCHLDSLGQNTSQVVLHTPHTHKLDPPNILLPNPSNPSGEVCTSCLSLWNKGLCVSNALVSSGALNGDFASPNLCGWFGSMVHDWHMISLKLYDWNPWDRINQ